MSLFFKAFLCAFIAVIVLFCHEYLQRLRKQMFSRPERTVFAIGILSGRENFEQREAGRSTWLKRYSSIESDVKAWFIVGNTSCEIPHEYRFNMYSCEKWNVNISGLQDKFYTAGQVQTLNCPPDSERRFFQGFSFQVNYPVVVTKLGILSSLLLQNSEVKIAIMDVQSKEILIQSLISTNESRASNGYIYADVGTILYFPKNYEGLVVVEGYLKDTACSDIGWNDGGGIITFKRVYPTPEHLDSKKYSSRLNVASSLGFFVPEMKSLKKLLYEEEFKTKQWYLHLEEINKRLRSEIAKNQDILIVDVIDTYRSLPVKLLKFYEWLHLNHDFLFVMKTDDDSVINISHLLKQLQEDSLFDHTKPWLWSNFRKNWPVNYIGKWADYDYHSPYYPSFPCGSAYVMSQKTALWLISNAEMLHIYQGEDVSMGIWLSAINPEFIEDENFECDIQCSFKSYNRAQLSPDQVHEVWPYFEKCQNLCSCNNTLVV